MASNHGETHWTAWQSAVVAWAKRDPKPVLVVGKQEGEEDVRHQVGTHKRAWTDLGTAMRHATRCEAFDEKGNLLRAKELDPMDVELAREADPRDAQRITAKDQRAIIAIDVPRLVREISEAMGSTVRTALSEQSKMFAPTLKAHGQLVDLLLWLLQSMAKSVPALPAEQAQPQSPIEAAMMRMMIPGMGGPPVPGFGVPGFGVPGTQPIPQQQQQQPPPPTNGQAPHFDLNQIAALLQSMGGQVTETTEPEPEGEGDA